MLLFATLESGEALAFLLGDGGDVTENNSGQLTGLQRAFVDEWFKDFNGTQAARRAGYSGDDNALAVRASLTLRNDKVRAEIERRWAAHGVTAEEVIARYVEQARGSIAEFLLPSGGIDWDKVKEQGHLVKKVTHRKGQQSQIELYDAQHALDMIGKSLGLFVDRHKHDHTSGGKAIRVLVGGIDLANDV